MKKLLLSLLLVNSLPVEAITKPDDNITIIASNSGAEMGGPGESWEKLYTKKWKDIKLDASTKTNLVKWNQLIEKHYDGYVKYRLTHLFLIDNRLLRVSFQSERGGVTMMDWPPKSGGQYSQVCRLVFDSNGGFAGIKGQACMTSDEFQEIFN